MADQKKEEPKPATPSPLAAITRGIIEKPPRIVCYGVEGIGKTTFAADAPAPIFLGAEDGTAQLDVARFPEPHTWSDVFSNLESLEGEKHDFKTLVIDTADWLEPLCVAAVCAKHPEGYTTLEEFGFGKGVSFAVAEWRKLLAALDRLRDNGMTVIVLGHSHVKTYNNPEGEDYDRYQMKLSPKVAALLREWPDAVLFANYETLVNKEKGARAKGIRGTARFLHTERTAAYDAKNRFGLPSRIPLSWSEFEGNREASGEQVAEALARIETLLEDANEKITTKARDMLKRAGKNTRKLAQLENWIQGKGNK